ncbi:MAG: D-arabinose 5-phosphate isomerase [Bdellovibrio sp.]|nr:MAG: D-arabinose 5-phosphate isomerase [Bdellovibrio sp.]
MKIIALAKQVLEMEARSILSLTDRIDGNFQRAVDLCAKCSGKVIWTGIGKSGHIARKLASTMSSTGTPALFLHPAESSHGDLGLLDKSDLLIAVSYGANSPELLPVIMAASRKGIPLIALTGNPASELAQRATVLINVKVSQEACPLGLAPTASSTASLAMGDALAMAVLTAKGFSAEDFAENHPGGSLGFRLAKVSDLMHGGEALPTLSLRTPMKEVFSIMSRGETRGAACVVDENGDLAGIITDGDIRRLLDRSKDPFAGLAGDFMSHHPRTVDAGELAEKALFLMEQFRINVLFVIDKSSPSPRRPVGLIHVQDLLRAKVR